MGKIGHKNLFQYTESRFGVYQTFQRDFDRDSWIQVFWRSVLISMAVGAARISGHFDWLWIFGGIFAAERALARYVDNSNRNWAMHVIDWLEHGRDSDTP